MRAGSAAVAALALLVLAACTGGRSSDVLTSAVSVPSGQPGEIAATVDPSTAIARLRMHALVGAPDSAAEALRQGLGAQATARRVALLPADATDATHDMKGYFSALTEGGVTTVIYVWDIFDASGNRVHRIQGQAAVSGASPDGWSAVGNATMQEIGQRTIEEFVQWRAARA